MDTASLARTAGVSLEPWAIGVIAVAALALGVVLSASIRKYFRRVVSGALRLNSSFAGVIGVTWAPPLNYIAFVVWAGAAITASLLLTRTGPLLALGVAWAIVLVTTTEWSENEFKRDRIARRIDDGNSDRLPDLRGIAILANLSLPLIFAHIFYIAKGRMPALVGLDHASWGTCLLLALDEFVRTFVFDVFEVFNWSGMSGIHLSTPPNSWTVESTLVALMRTTYALSLIAAFVGVLRIRRTQREAVEVLSRDPHFLWHLGNRGRQAFYRYGQDILRYDAKSFDRLTRFRVSDSSRREFTDWLLRLAKNEPAAVAASAIEALGSLGAAEKISEIIDLKKRNEPIVRAAIIVTLLRFGKIEEIPDIAEDLPKDIAANLITQLLMYERDIAVRRVNLKTAEEIAMRLIEKRPDYDYWLPRLARIHRSIRWESYAFGRGRDEDLALCRRQLEFWERQDRTDPLVTEERADISDEMGDLCDDTNQNEAITFYEEAANLYRALLEGAEVRGDRERNITTLNALGRILHKQAVLYQATAKNAEATHALMEAKQALRSAIKRQPMLVRRIVYAKARLSSFTAIRILGPAYDWACDRIESAYGTSTSYDFLNTLEALLFVETLIGRSARAEGRKRKARASLRDAVAILEPGIVSDIWLEPEFLVTLGDDLRALRVWPSARKAYDLAHFLIMEMLRLEPEDEDARYWRAIIVWHRGLLELEKRRRRRGKKFLDDASKQFNELSATGSYSEKRCDEALNAIGEALRKAIELEPFVSDETDLDAAAIFLAQVSRSASRY